MTRHPLASLAALLLGLLAGCGAPPDPAAPPDAGRELRRGRQLAHVLVRRTREVASPDSVAAEDALALGYLERARLGMGSPFRAAEQALRDPRLADTLRTRLAWALLALAADGEGFQVDPAALDPAGWGSYAPGPGRGGLHLELIGDAVEEAGDPRSGERAVRMAYAVAAAAGDAGPTTPRVAARAAALLRDRRLAREDARALLRAADSLDASPLHLLPAWRSARRFRVEAPLLLPPDADAERAAAGAALRLAARVRAAARPRAPQAYSPHTGDGGLLGPGAAERLARLADASGLPPQPPVATTVRSFREFLLAGVPDDAPHGEPRRRLLRDAWNEERFVAELARLRASGAEGPGPGSVALAVAVAMRGYAQEPVWFPGFPAPTERELRTRYALGTITFAERVPAAWRPYSLRMLETSILDLKRVFPGFAVEGLRVRFRATGREEALATHTPSPRALTLPPETAAGTLAHELSHDLDWQAARARWGARGAYLTDRAVRGGRGPLARSVRALASAPLEVPAPRTGERASPDRRPTEVFARHADWYVAAALARRGLSNGYLSAVQDAAFPGYAGAAPPDGEGRAAAATVRILGELTPLPPGEAAWFLERFGPGRAAPLEERVAAALEGRLPDPAREAEGGCGPGGALLGEDPLRREVVALAARARARGRVLDDAERLAGREGRRWMARQLDGTLWSPAGVDSATAALLEPLAERVKEGAERGSGWGRGGRRSPFALPAPACGELPRAR